MKPINIQNIDKYPDNYNNFSQEQKDIVINYMNRVQQLANHYYQKYFEEAEDKTLKLYQHTLTSLTGSKNAYATMGLMLEYGWPNHNKEWFLATKEDAENYINTPDNQNIDTEIVDEVSKLIYYGDIL